MRGKIITIFAVFLIVSFFPFASFGKTFKPPAKKPPVQRTVEPDPVVTITPPKEYKTRRILLFPFDIPSYAIRAATWPFGAGIEYLNKKGYVEKAIDFLSNKDRTFWVYPIIEGGVGTGFGGGVGVSHSNLFHKGYTLDATYRIHINLDQRATFSFGKPDAFMFLGRPASYLIESNFSRITSDDFYGIGNSSSQSDHSEFMYDGIDVKGSLSYEVVKHVSLIPFLGASFTNSGTGRSSNYPNVNVTFPPDNIEGYGKWLDYMVLGLTTAHDTRNNQDTPDAGGIRSVTYRRFQCFNRSEYNYNQFDIDIRQYIRVFKPQQVLILRNAWRFQSATGADTIPFYRLATLDAYSPLRGFSRNRFQDKNYMLFNVEYRFPVWSLINGVMFVDFGRVFPKLTDISFNHIKYSVGGGVHFRVPKIALFRLETAYGGEGMKVLLGATKPL